MKIFNIDTDKVITNIETGYKSLNAKISELNTKVSDATKKVGDLEVKINTDNTRIITRLNELKREISNVETTSINAIPIINAANKTSKEELDNKIRESNNEIAKIKTLLLDENDKRKTDKENKR